MGAECAVLDRGGSEMEFGLWLLIGVLAAVAGGLALKIGTMRRAAREIREELEDRLTTDTNMLIGISSRDRRMCELADSLNSQLRLLQEQRRRYVQGDRELKQAVTNLSHDLRTPLTAISGYLDLLKREEKNPVVERDLAIIAERTQVMKRLAEELFSYSVILSADREGERSEVSLNAVLEESLSAYYGVLVEKGIEPQIEIPEERVFRYLDREMLARVFANLLSNAAKYSAGDLSVSLNRSGEIRFANSAPGLDAVEAQRLFERFYTVKSGRDSTGLGLSIARTLVQQMGGSIRSDYRGGLLVITVCFPPDMGEKKG